MMPEKDYIIMLLNEELGIKSCGISAERYYAQNRNVLNILHGFYFDERHGACFIGKDRNRAEDAICMKKHYLFDNYSEPELCSVLEMMIALSHRLNSEYIYTNDVPGGWIIFNDMLQSMTLSPEYVNRIDDIHYNIIRMLQREYRPNGFGGLFYVKHFRGDMRKMEIWDQAMVYIDAKFVRKSI